MIGTSRAFALSVALLWSAEALPVKADPHNRTVYECDDAMRRGIWIKSIAGLKNALGLSTKKVQLRAKRYRT